MAIKKYKNLLSATAQLQRIKLLSFMLLFALVGTVITFVTHAAGSSIISGVAFQDTNRNGIQDAGEAPMASKGIYLLDATGQAQVSYTVTNASGRYVFSGLNDATYQIEYEPTDWWAIRYDLVPTTTGTIYPKTTVNLQGEATANFGWRQIVRSTDTNAPISTFTAPNGMKINSYNDAVTAQEVYNHYLLGNLIGKEAPLTTILLDRENFVSNADISLTGGPPWSNFNANLSLSYIQWLENDVALFHEYGHSWSFYYAKIEAQSDKLTDYLKIRGITDHPKLGTSHAWSPWELIAEDYRQLFGSPSAQSVSQENYELPPAKDVTYYDPETQKTIKLADYLSDTFMRFSADTVPPTAPANLKATVISPGEVKLSWTASTDNVGVTKYKIYRYSSADGGQHVYKEVDSSATTYTDTGLSPDINYHYTVTAYDATNNQTPSSEIIVKTSAPDTIAPSVPTGLVGTSTSSDERSDVKLSWTASTDNVAVDKYLVYRNGAEVGYVNSPATTFTDTGLLSSTPYQYSVKAADAAGNTSNPSQAITVTTQPSDIQAPTAPTGLISPAQTNNSISLKWNASTDNKGVTGYRVYKVGGNRKNSLNTLVATVTFPNHTVTGLSKGTSYAFYVTAIDASGNQSAPSNTLTAKTRR